MKGDSFRQAVINVCHQLNVSGVFPRTFDESLLRASKTESVHAWFQRVVQKGLSGDIERCLAESNIAIFGKANVQKGAVMAASLQMLVTPGCDAQAYIDGSANCEPVYFRLDVDPGNPGKLFKEDLPHVHLRLHGEPRVGWGWPVAHNIFFDFIEFVYRNFAYEQWAEWAKEEWRRYQSDRQGDLPRWDTLDNAYRAGLTAADTREYGKHMLTLKETLIGAQKKYVPKAIVPNEFSKLCYLSRAV